MSSLSIDMLMDAYKLLPEPKTILKGILITRLMPHGIYHVQAEDGQYLFINNITWVELQPHLEKVIADTIFSCWGYPVYEDEGFVAKFILEHTNRPTDEIHKFMKMVVDNMIKKLDNEIINGAK